jgi:hypothetical protein
LVSGHSDLCTILAIFFISFDILVKKPLGKISQALFTKSSDDRMKLKNLKSEFKKIGSAD